MHFFIPSNFLHFQNLVPTLPTIQLNHQTSLEDVYQISCSFIWSQKKGLYYFFFIYAVVLPKTCKHVKLLELPFKEKELEKIHHTIKKRCFVQQGVHKDLH